MGKIVKSIFGGGEKVRMPAPIPIPPPPPATPMVDEDAILRKKRKAMAAQQNRSGRTALASLSRDDDGQTFG